MKKVISLLAALTLMVSMLAFNASAAADIEFSITKAEGKPGDIVTVDVYVDKNAGTWSMSLDVKYDSRYFDLLSATNGDVFTNSEQEEGLIDDSGSYRYYAANNELEEVKEVGKLLTLEFKILKAAPNGNHEIDIFFPDNGDGWFFGIVDIYKPEYVDRTVELVKKGIIKVEGSSATEAPETTDAPDEETTFVVDTDETPDSETVSDTDRETDKTPDSESMVDTNRETETTPDGETVVVTDKETGKTPDEETKAPTGEETDKGGSHITYVTEMITELVTDAKGEVVTDAEGEPLVTEVPIVVPEKTPISTDEVSGSETEKTPATDKTPETEIVYVTDAEGEQVTEPDGKPVTEIVEIDENEKDPVNTVVIIICIVAVVAAAALISFVVVARRKNDNEGEAEESEESEKTKESDAEDEDK